MITATNPVVPPSVTVLLVQWGRTELTTRAVDAVRRSRYSGEIEILVFDNGSEGGPGPVAGDPALTLVAHPENIGFGPANNRLAERASGDLLLLLNNDTVLAPACLARMVDRLVRDSRTAAVAPQFRSFDGRVLELGGYVGSSGEAWQLMRGEQPPHGLLSRPAVAHYGSAACLLMRRRDFLDAGGFDDLFAPAYYEDTDLCLRFAAEGRQVVVEPSAVVYHLEGGTAGTDTSSGPKAHQVRNRGRFASRWSEQLRALPPVDRSAALRHSLTGGERPLVLWLLPDFLKPDRSGGHARVRKEIEVLAAAGIEQVVWSEHIGDHGRYGRFLSELGIAWLGYQEPIRSQLDQRHGSSLRSLHDLLELPIWDGIIAWSADVGYRFGPVVRELTPQIPYFVDSAVLHYLQCERGLEVGASIGEDLVAEKAWELGVYGAADGLIASSEADAEAVRGELPNLDVFTFDVGAYEPVPALPDQMRGPLVFLGNFIHPPNIDAVVWWVEEIAPWIEELCGRAIPLRVIGASAELIADVIDPGPALDVVGWVEDLGPEMSRARALVVPLRYGAGTKDKISIAMRYGVPTVTTAMGAESMPTSLLEALIVADQPKQLASQVIRLMANDRAWTHAAESTRTAARLAWSDQEQVEDRYVRWLSERLTSPASPNRS